VEEGFYTQMLYPVEGDSAIAELYYDDEQWANVWLEGINLDAVGDARVQEARVVVELFSPLPGPAEARWGSSWRLDLDEVCRRLDDARQILIENERGRVPVADDGVTAAGRAWTKMSQKNADRFGHT
jgi:hypothetical protein